MKNQLLSAATLPMLVLAGCLGAGGGDPEIYGSATGGTIEPDLIKQGGSSTVLPLAEVWADDFGTARGIEIRVASGGSGKGATGLCDGELDLGDMSREMTAQEHQQCLAKNGKDAIQWKVAFDGLSIVVSNDNDFVQDLTVEQLAHIFRAQGHADTWDDVDPSYPARPIRLCYPDSDSGTYEYFNEVVLDEGEPRTGDGVEQAANDNTLVTCLAGDRNAIGYFGYAYVINNEDKVRAIAVDGVQPTPETIADGTYAPLSRPVYIYTSGVPQGILGDYMRYVYHPEGGQAYVDAVGYVPLDDETRQEMLAQLG